MSDFTDDLFGVWTTEPHVTKSLENDAALGNEPIWQLDLPLNTTEARAILHSQSVMLKRDQKDVDQAVQRLSVFIDAWEPSQNGAAKSLDIAVPEANLHEALEAIQSPQTKGLLDPLRAAKEEFDRFVQRVRELIANFARIETTSGGQLIGQTVVGWTGDFQTVWRESTTVEQIGLHHQNVRLALARRQTLMRLVVVISAGAAKIALRLATPGAQLLVIPAIWQFIREVINEYQGINESTRNPST